MWGFGPDYENSAVLIGDGNDQYSTPDQVQTWSVDALPPSEISVTVTAG